MSHPSILSNLLRSKTDNYQSKITNTFYELLDVLDKHLMDSSKKLLLLNLPTGYGKTRASVVLGLAAQEGFSDSFLRVIHVVPTRCLVEDIIDHAKVLGLKAAVQYMFADPYLKAPYFLASFIVTTLDSYSYNFLKIPIAEYRYIELHGLGHAEIPRASIYTGLSYIDEYHVFTLSEEVMKNARAKTPREYIKRSSTFLFFTIDNLISKSIAHVVLSTATPTITYEEIISGYLSIPKDLIIEIDYDANADNGIKEISKGRYIINDSEFTSDRLSSRIVTEVNSLSLDRMSKLCLEEYEKGIICLLALNTVDRAINAYEGIKEVIGDKVIVIHSRFRLKEREELRCRLKSMRERRPGIVIASPALEVGVDVDAEVLVSDAAPLTSIIQRCGRILRRLGSEGREGKVIISYSDELVNESRNTYTGIYPLDLVKHTVLAIKDVLSKGFTIDWKLPFTNKLNGRISYLTLMKSIKRSCPFYFKLEELIDFNYFSLLSNLVRPLISNISYVRVVLNELGSFVKDHPLIPVLIPDEVVDPSSAKRVLSKYLGEDFHEYLLPLEYGLILKAEKYILHDEGGVYVVIEDLRGELSIERIEGKLKDILRLFISPKVIKGKYFIVSLIGTGEGYSIEEGLKLP